MEEELDHSLAVNAITERAIEITVHTAPRSTKGRILARLGLAKTTRTFHLRPLKVGTLLLVSSMIGKLPSSIFDEAGGLPQEVVEKHLERLVQIVAQALHNSETEPPKALSSLIRKEFDLGTLSQVLELVKAQMRLSDFIKSTVLLKGINILPRTGPQRAGGTIAPGV